MTPEERRLEEEQIKNIFSQLQKKLEELQNEVQAETNDAKKQEKTEEIQRLEKELAEIKEKIDILTSLSEEKLLALKTKLEEYQQHKQEILSITKLTPTTYEILKDSETYSRLLTVISSNPREFQNLP